MSLTTTIETDGVTLSPVEARRIERRLEALGRRLVHHPAPTAVVALRRHEGQRRVEVDLRVQLGPLGAHLVSHRQAETAAHALRLAVEDVERQLERRLADQRGEATFGVPSRREPATLRPRAPPTRRRARS